MVNVIRTYGIGFLVMILGLTGWGDMANQSEAKKLPRGVLSGFTTSSYLNEQVKEYSFDSEVRIVINAPAADKFNPGMPTWVIVYALPNGNTIEQTIGRTTTPGMDWHFDIQHIGAQTRMLREGVKDRNIVVAYLQAYSKSWPAWTGKHPDSDKLIPKIWESVLQPFRDYHPELMLSSHSGGGALLLRYLRDVKYIPDEIQRIVFMDSIYNYNEEYKHGEKLARWLKRSRNHALSVISYDDREVLYNGKHIVSPTGGTWYRTSILYDYLTTKLPFDTVTTDNYIRHRALNGRVDLILNKNPNNKILHTVMVGEMNGFIQSITSGTKYENQIAVFGIPPAYKKWIQP